MPQLRVRPHAPAADGTVLEVTPQSAGWRHVGFKVVHLQAGERHAANIADRETCLVLVAGTADISAGHQSFSDVGGRASPFEDKAPGAVYVPAGVAFEVIAKTTVELAVCTAPGSGARGRGPCPRRSLAAATRRACGCAGPRAGCPQGSSNRIRR